jgi:ribosomal protein S18 acetylase RimI-like enzyme
MLNTFESSPQSCMLNQELKNQLREIFDAADLAQQPRYIADLASGDGAFLQAVLDLVREQTLRGKQLEQFPLDTIPAGAASGEVQAEARAKIDVAEALLKDASGQVLFLDCAIREHDLAESCMARASSAELARWHKVLGQHRLVTRVTATAADAIFLNAAGAGLLPRSAPVAAADNLLVEFAAQAFRVRPACAADMDGLMEIENRSWEAPLRTPQTAIEQRMATYPQGQLVLELDGRVAGVVYTQRICDSAAIYGQQVQRVAELHNPEGGIVMLLGLSILPEYQSRRLGDQLLEFALQLSAVLPGVRTVVGVTLCKNYYRHQDLGVTDYVERRDASGRRLDPHLNWHERHGARVVGVVPDYRPLDLKNRGFGVLVEYDLARRICRRRL